MSAAKPDAKQDIMTGTQVIELLTDTLARCGRAWTIIDVSAARRDAARTLRQAGRRDLADRLDRSRS